MAETVHLKKVDKTVDSTKKKEDCANITNLHSELNSYKRKYELAEQDISKLQVQVKKLEGLLKRQDDDIQSNVKVIYSFIM